MLTIYIPEKELFDELTDRFVKIKKQTIRMEHSLISISNWEAKWNKPFLSKKEKTKEEILDYIRCMMINPQNDNVILAFGPKEINQVIDYINAPMTATTVTFYKQTRQRPEIITSELIYYWMFSAQVPIECEKWHLNRLFALLKIISAKNQPKKKGFDAGYAKRQSELNAKRRAKMHSKG